MKYFRLRASNIAIDLGTANVLVYEQNKGIVLNEPAVVALDINTGAVVAFGNAAFEMIGKTPDNIIAIKPLQNGVVSDFEITKILIDHCIKKVLKGISIMQPNVVITAPSGVSEVELRAIEDACIYSGAKGVYIVEGTLAAAIGAGMDLNKAKGHMVIDMGAGNTEIGIVSLNGIVASKTIKIGGDTFNQRIISFLKNKYSINVGYLTAEELKKTIGNVGQIVQNDAMEVSGRDIMTGMPITVDVYSTDIKEAIIDDVETIIDTVKYILEKNPPELSSDIIKNGIFLTGGASRIKGFKEILNRDLNIKIVSSNTPFEDSCRGAGKMIENLERYKG